MFLRSGVNMWFEEFGLRRCGGLGRRCGGLLRRCGGLFKEVWWSRGNVPASGPPGLGSNLGLGPPHIVV